MGRKRILTEQVKGIIADVYLKHKKWTAWEIKAEVNQRIDGKGLGLSAIQKQLTELRKHDEKWEKELDKPWTIGSMNKCAIPPETLPVVLQVWRKQLNWIEPLTVRQARWVVRLCTTIPDGVVLLTHWAQLYALWERMCSLSDIDFDSSAFDAALVMRPWELITALLTDKVTAKMIPAFPIDELVRLSNENYVDTMEEIDRVFDSWRHFMIKGPLWADLTKELRGKVEIYLRKWVLDRPWIEDGEWLSKYIDKGFSREDLDNNPLFKPTELLKVVGY